MTVIFQKNSRRPYVQRTGLLIIGLLTSGCIGTGPEQNWDMKADPPESTVNSAYCGNLLDESPETARVREGNSSSSWRIEYPSFESGCGVYQLDAHVRIDEQSTQDGSYRHEISVCNRCETSHSWNYLDSGLIASEANDKPIPESLNRSEVENGLFPEGGAVVTYTGRGTTTELEIECQSNENFQEVRDKPKYWNLENVIYFEVSPDSTRTFNVPRDFRSFRSAWLETDSDTEKVKTTIHWPRLFHKNFNLNGAHVASTQQFCVEESGRIVPGGYYNRPFSEPYRPELKYTQQEITRPNLPTALVEFLKQQSP